MNQSLQYGIDFAGAIWYNGALQINTYSVNLQLITASERPVIVGVALERIKAFVMGELANVLFINHDHDTVAEMFDALGANVCTLPDEPHDLTIAMMLFCKLTAIVENNLVVSQLDVSSSLGDEVWYQIGKDDPLGPFAQDGWWHKPNCQKHSLCTNTDANVVKVQTSGWQDYELEWPEIPNGSATTIVKPDFHRHDSNQAR